MTTLDETLARRRGRSRKYDLVLFGATGYTGRLVAEYLEGAAPRDLRWAIGGRDKEKLGRVKDGLGLRADVVVGDSQDSGFLKQLTADAGVVCSTVGPYARHGSELVAACVERGTDYCDLTGEPQWIRRMIDRHHDAARRSGARIVHCCGFDSIPSDLGCLMVHEHFRARGGGLREATLYVDRIKGGMSGGTLASLLNVLEEARSDATTREVIKDAYSLNPPGERQGPDSASIVGVRHDAKGWTGPFLMAPINARIVRRSNALLGYPYTRDFRYDERMRFPDTMKGMLLAGAITTGIAAFAGAASIGPARELLRRHVLTPPGQGPSASAREAGFVRITIVAQGHTREGAQTAVGRIETDQDPGYGATARMLGEASLCLAFDGPHLDSPGGVLTPASCLGTSLLERLRRAGMVMATSAE